jgi:Tfp pilus assembly protein PilF
MEEPDFMSAHFERGRQLFELKSNKLAEQAFRDALIEDPNSAAAHAMLAMTLSRLGAALLLRR